MSNLLKLNPDFRVVLPEGSNGGTGESEYARPYRVAAMVAGATSAFKVVVPDAAQPRLGKLVSLTNGDVFLLGAKLDDREPPHVTLRVYPEFPVVAGQPVAQGDPIEFGGRPHEYPTGSGEWDLRDLGDDNSPTVVPREAYIKFADLLTTGEQVIIRAERAADRAHVAADRAERNAFTFERAWAPGFYERGSVVTHRASIWRANEDTDTEPQDSDPRWDLLIPPGKQGLPGLPGTVNGISADDLAIYSGDLAPHSEDPPSAWPRAVRTFDIRGGLSRAYPFDTATVSSYGAEDGATHQFAFVQQTVRDELMTTLWLRSSLNAFDWRPWRRGTGEEGLSLERFTTASRIINGSGELGKIGWTKFGDALTFWDGHDDPATGLVLEYYRIGSAAALTTPTGVYQDVAIFEPLGNVQITVECLSLLGNPRLYVDYYAAGTNTIYQTTSDLLKLGVHTYSSGGQREGGAVGRARIHVMHMGGTTGDLYARFRIALGQLQQVVPGDPRRSLRALHDDLQAFKAQGGTAQLAQNSLGASSGPSLYPEGLSYLPTTGSGWPFAGVVETVRPRTATDPTATRQTIRQTNGPGIQQRTATAAGGWGAFTPYAEKGTRGSKSHTGIGPPAQNTTLTDVLPGDDYREQITGDVYLRGATAWGATPIFNLKGATGVSSYTRERRTGGKVGCLHVLINGVWQVASPSNSTLELMSWGVLGSDNVMYGPGAEAVVDGLEFLPGKNYYLGFELNNRNLFPFDSVIPNEALPSQAQRLFVIGATPRGVSNRLFLDAAAEPLDVEPVAQLYRVTPLSFAFDTDLGPAGLNELIRNIATPPAGQTSSGGLSIRVVQDGNTGSVGANTVGQPSPHLDGGGRALFIRAFEFNNTFHAYTPTDWPEVDDGNMLLAWQHNNLGLGKPAAQLVSTGNHTAPSLYYVEHTGTQIGLRKRTTVNGVINDVPVGAYVTRALPNHTIILTRVSKQGGNIKAKAWIAPAGWHLAGANLQEPAAWDIERVDTSILGAGRWGGTQRTDFTRYHALSLATLDAAASF